MYHRYLPYFFLFLDPRWADKSRRGIFVQPARNKIAYCTSNRMIQRSNNGTNRVMTSEIGHLKSSGFGFAGLYTLDFSRQIM